MRTRRVRARDGGKRRGIRENGEWRASSYLGCGRFLGTKSDGAAFFLTTVATGGRAGADADAPDPPAAAPPAGGGGAAPFGRPGNARLGTACSPTGSAVLRSSTSPSSSFGLFAAPPPSAAAPVPFGRLSCAGGAPTSAGLTPGRRECAAPSEGSYVVEVSSGAALDLTTAIGAVRTTGGANDDARNVLTSAWGVGGGDRRARVSQVRARAVRERETREQEGGGRDAPCGRGSSPLRRQRACPSTG